MSTVTGQEAEQTAAGHLQKLKYKIKDRNWKTKYCEIDIVAEKANVVWFVEVKFRSTGNQGYGHEYVTPKKLEQMRFAAEMWVQSHDWRGEYRLAVMSIDGDDIQFIEDIIL